MGGTARVAVRPEWVGLLDFERRSSIASTPAAERVTDYLETVSSPPASPTTS
jgi:hypothetical protein